jgi:hypothetical protein
LIISYRPDDYRKIRLSYLESVLADAALVARPCQLICAMAPDGIMSAISARDMNRKAILDSRAKIPVRRRATNDILDLIPRRQRSGGLGFCVWTDLSVSARMNVQ